MDSNTISNLTDLELKICFEEIVDYKKKGILPVDALTRKVRMDFVNEVTTDKSWDSGCDFTSNCIVFEIAKRHYNFVERR